MYYMKGPSQMLLLQENVYSGDVHEITLDVYNCSFFWKIMRSCPTYFPHCIRARFKSFLHKNQFRPLFLVELVSVMADFLVQQMLLALINCQAQIKPIFKPVAYHFTSRSTISKLTFFHSAHHNFIELCFVLALYCSSLCFPLWSSSPTRCLVE